jgi:hypothetical protein
LITLKHTRGGLLIKENKLIDVVGEELKANIHESSRRELLAALAHAHVIYFCAIAFWQSIWITPMA